MKDNQEIINALCESCDRCTVCFGYMDINKKENCGRCNEYYCECNCEPLKPMDIINHTNGKE